MCWDDVAGGEARRAMRVIQLHASRVSSLTAGVTIIRVANTEGMQAAGYTWVNLDDCWESVTRVSSFLSYNVLLGFDCTPTMRNLFTATPFASALLP
jgi:hypothetical protein